MTIRINADLHKKFKIKCYQNGVSIKEKITELMEKFVSEKHTKGRSK